MEKRLEMEEIGEKKNCMVGNMGGKKTWWGPVVFHLGPQKEEKSKKKILGFTALDIKVKRLLYSLLFIYYFFSLT